MFATSDEIRSHFSLTMSDMYRLEVPLYGDLLALVADINARQGSSDEEGGRPARIAIERHGAIRLGTPQELATMRRVLAVMGMHPVGYYDLSTTGLPVHATAFRPTDARSLAVNPFRLFTSLLRLELIRDEALRRKAAELLARRQIFTDRLLELLAVHEAQGGLSQAQANEFVSEAMETFRWHGTATVSHSEYQQMNAEHRLVADIVCFKGPHINHLTPRTLDIDAAQQEMIRRGIPAKDVIEGPPTRRCPILLRQTSFKALEERVTFIAGGQSVQASHTARFGEIEQRGQALTPVGRALYDRLLEEANRCGSLEDAFRGFPDDLDAIRQQGLGYFRYELTDAGRESGVVFTRGRDLEAWIRAGWVAAQPILYEDFLPVSAAGIFRSNLGDAAPWADPLAMGANQAAFEQALGAPVRDAMTGYAQEEAASLDRLFAAGVNLACPG